MNTNDALRLVEGIREKRLLVYGPNTLPLGMSVAGKLTHGAYSVVDMSASPRTKVDFGSLHDIVVIHGIEAFDDETRVTRREDKVDFILALDAVSKSPNKVIICTTNTPWDLDPALRRRFPHKVYLGPSLAPETFAEWTAAHGTSDC